MVDQIGQEDGLVSQKDLRAAVSSGLLTEAQAANLISLAQSRRGARENLSAGDEPFELFKGFNEIFIVVGLLIFAAGWYALTGIRFFAEINNVQSYTGTITGIGAVTLWLLSEYFIRRRRMVAPAIALSILFAGNAALGFTGVFSEPFMLAQNDYTSVPLPLLYSTLALAVFWFRFRVPFALAMIALGLFATSIIFAATKAGPVETVSDLFLLSAGGPFAWITLALGLIVFAVAMTFDMSDPHRVTRRAANGFWMHVIAAPMLVNTIALTLLAGQSNLALAAVLAFFALIAIVIDRRSFLITAIGYSVALSMTVLENESAATTVFGLGAVLLILGAFWEQIRAAVLRLCAGILPLHRLPPSHA